MKVALVGNQNSGKTTLFNYLTGMNSKVGNWPGVTIDKKIGVIKSTIHEIVDLPGIYSLSPYSTEEEISRKFIFEEKPDVIINIIDATSIERSLYLTTQLIELDCKVIIALNMVDMLEKKGLTIDVEILEKRLGVKVFKISALKETGIEELIKEIDKNSKKIKVNLFDLKLESTISGIEFLLPNDILHKRFLAIKLLEGDVRFKNYFYKEIKELKESLEKSYNTDLEEEIATQRYIHIEKVKKQSVGVKALEINISDKLDKIFLNKWVAFPIFAVIMFSIYYLSVGVIGNFTVDFITKGIENLSENIRIFLESIGVIKPVSSLIVDGIIVGVGAVLKFIPQLMILFLCISILETTGYMSRIALLLDNMFRKLGLSGKSLIPFIVGSGCSVPGIMASKIIENEDERKITTILTPFIPCSAKLPIIALFSGYFFKENSGVVSASLYFFAIFIIVISAYFMKKFIFKNISPTYISELPEYKLPNIKYVFKDVLEKVSVFIQRAGTVILICSIVIWFLVSFSFELEYGVYIEKSILATIGNKISWIFYPILGTNSWGATVSAIQGLVAKEQVVSSMSIIAGVADKSNQGNVIFKDGSVFSFFTSSSAYAYMVFNLFSAPCFGAIAAMKRELGGNKRMLKAVTFQTIIAWVLSTIVFQIGSKIENGTVSISSIIVIAIIVLLISQGKNKTTECRECPYCNSCKK